MTTAAIRQKLHSYLEVADDKKVKAIYAIMEEQIEEYDADFDDELKAELDKREAEYQSGQPEVFTAEESKKRIDKILKAKRK